MGMEVTARWFRRPSERGKDGMVWYGTLLYGMVLYGMIWYGMVLYRMIWYVTVWYGILWYGMVRLCRPSEFGKDVPLTGVKHINPGLQLTISTLLGGRKIGRKLIPGEGGLETRPKN